MAEDQMTEWRAYEHNPASIWGWCVDLVLDGHRESTLAGLDEPTARLIAAALARDRLCEELADALEGLWQLVENGELVRDISRDADGPAFTIQAMTIVSRLKKAEAALKAAGRAPQ